MFIHIAGESEPDNISHGLSLYRESNYPELNFQYESVEAKTVFDKFLCPITVFSFDFCLRSLDASPKFGLASKPFGLQMN